MNTRKETTLTHLSLFSGIGGIDLAAHHAGFETVAFVENDPFCQKVLRKHWAHVPIFGDIKQFNGEQFRNTTIISAGFPCQPHSIAGKRKASSDSRDLWGETVRVLLEAKPRWFLGENVTGLLTSERRHFFGRILSDLASLGYRVGWSVYGASEVGACHQRKRVFIIAYSAQLYGDGGVTEPERQLSESGNRNSPQDVAYSDCQRFGFGCYFRTGRPLSSNVNWHLAQGEQKGHRRLDWSCPADDVANSDGSRQQEQEQPSRPKTQFAEPLNPSLGAGNTCFCGLHGVTRCRTGTVAKDGYIQLPPGDWQSWDIKPVVRRGNDRLSRRLDKCRLKALGNAVVPQQIYPILHQIAQEEKNEH